MENSSNFLTSTISLFIFLVLIGFGWLLRTRFKIKLGLSYAIFSIFTSIGIWIVLNYRYGLFKNVDLRSFITWYEAIVAFFAVLFITKIFSVFFWDYYLFRYRKTQVPGLLRSVVTVLILIATILLIIRFIFDKQLSGLLVASSVTAGLLAFALQDFLSGLIAGIALNIEPPFQVGDWVMLGDKEGEVVDINWRATTLRTLDTTYLVVPNSIISKEQINNFYKPTKVHAIIVNVGVEYSAPPTKVKDILISCALETKGVLSMHRPISRLINFGDFSITYELKFWIEDHSIYKDIKSDVMTRIWYNLGRNNVRIPFPIRDIFIHEEAEKKETLEEISRRKIEEFLRRVSIFEPLDDTAIHTLAFSGRLWRFGRGEQIVKQGDLGSSFFLILEGSADVLIRLANDGRVVTVGHLHTGDFFGEKSLLTGESRSATVMAETDLEVVEIEKKNLLPILENTPGIMEDLSKRLAERQLVNEGFFREGKRAEEVAVMRSNYTERFLQSMKVFFGL
ncbi:MAG TPA: mechanosensitive ion channel family protein [Thermodesulfobacteriota bacterium]